ncbi:MAG TPA: MarR family transcriptional regulator [Gaiellaceae bacterium]|jgi:DNA-binding MarR family transcriptional regulator|nr:MarR family transcriptional regulator [Gaiellaceae bacterium]
MTPSLDTLFDLSLARTQLARDVDHPLSSHGISLADLAILRELRAEPSKKLRRSELAQRLGVTPSGIARQVAPLERIGLVARESHDRDARLALVVLTDTGAQIVDEALQTAEAAADRALAARWSDAERERLSKLLARARG